MAWGEKLKVKIRTSIKEQRPNILRVAEQMLEELNFFELRRADTNGTFQRREKTQRLRQQHKY
jgi:hypothetical protein